MASSVTMLFFKDSVSSSAGIAVISFDLPSTSRWPSAKPCSLALTRCSGPCARLRSKERRRVLPSIATTSRSNGLGKGLRPGAEAGLEGVRVDQHEDAPEGVVRGNAVGQAQERLQPRQLAAAVQRDVVPALGARDHRAHGDDQDIDQAMLDLACTARIFDRCKVLDQLLHRHRRPPFVAEEITGTACQTVRSCSPFSCVAPGPAGPRRSIHTPGLWTASRPGRIAPVWCARYPCRVCG